ncbi:MAG: hypothetical protein HYX26_01565 [Acidobacteriales bacterium]|nr:hypothetical protein [Terriglobales bacterium]
MKNLNRDIRRRNKKKNERGVALFMALFALLLLSAIAMGMMFLSTTETQVNYNYRDAQRAYFASQAGLEIVRDAMRSNGAFVPKDLPSTSNPTGVLYILNPPANGATVDPTDPKSAYFDYDLCHGYWKELGITQKGFETPCVDGAPSGSYTILNTLSPAPLSDQLTMIKNKQFANLNFRWVRITLKHNDATPYKVNTNNTYARQQVCWQDEDPAGYSQHIINVEGAQAAPNVPGPEGPLATPELAAARALAQSGAGETAMFAFGAKGKSTTTTGTSTTGTSTTGTSTTGTSTTGTSTTGTSTTGTSTTGTSTTGTSTTGTSTTGTSTTGSTTGGKGTTTGGTTTGSSGSYYAAIDNCQNSAQPKRYSVYLITSLAVTQTGARRLTQFEVSRHPFPPVPGGLTFNGPAPNFNAPNSNNFTINGHDKAVAGPNCVPSGFDIHAVTVSGAPSVTAITADIVAANHPDYYTGLGTDGPSQSPPLPPLSPDVIDGNTVDPYSGKTWLKDYDTVNKNEALVQQYSDLADTLSLPADPLNPAGTDSNSLPLKYPSCSSYPLGAALNDDGSVPSGVPAECAGPKITVIKQNFDLKSASGAGILVVTGDLTISGNFTWEGIILVVGSGKIIANGGGNRYINGGIFVAQTRDRTSPFALRGTLGNPDVDWNGGGTNEIKYNSCRLNQALSGATFRVITYREISY